MRHARGLNAFYRGFEAAAGAHARCVSGARLRAHRAAGRRSRASRQRAAVRLPDVRPMRAELDRHVLPDELPQELAQRSLRRRARRRPLRGEARHEMRVGGGLSRQPAHSGRHRGDEPVQHAVDQRQQGRSSWLRVVREKTGEGTAPARERRVRRAAHEIRGRAGPGLSRCRSCPATPRPAASSACCAPAASR